MIDLEATFPNFAGLVRSWTEVPSGQDPPDLISRDPSPPIGLELVEWLDGDQMGPAKARESQRDQMRRILAGDWRRNISPRADCGAAYRPPTQSLAGESHRAAIP
jgi:hypothetical protein